MAKFKGIVALKKEDLDILFNTGSVTLKDGTILNYADDVVYVTEDKEIITSGITEDGHPFIELVFSKENA